MRAGTRVLRSPQLLSAWPAPQMAPSARAHARRCVRADSPADTWASPAPAGPTSLPLGASRAPGPLPARFSRHREPHTSLCSRTGWKALALGFALSLPGRGRGWHRRAAGRQLRLPIRTPHAARRPGACTAPRPGCVHSAGARHQGRFENISCRLRKKPWGTPTPATARVDLEDTALREASRSRKDTSPGPHSREVPGGVRPTETGSWRWGQGWGKGQE